MDDQDIAGMLPDPPPPRATRREAAIGAAMRRFDGLEAGVDARRPAVAWQRPAWTRMNRTQIGAFASIALVAIVGIPLALNSLPDRFPAAVQPAPRAIVADSAVTVQPERGRTAAPSPLPLAPQPRIAPSAAPVPSAALPSLAAAPPVQDCGKGDCTAALAPARDRTNNRFASAKRMEGIPSSEPPSQSFAAAGRATQPAEAPQPEPAFVPPPPPPAAPPAAKLAAAENDELAVVVTGSRVMRSPARRGDWNACTVNDPNRSLEGCRRLVDSRAKGAAAERLAEGLALAWAGDLDGAIAAFDAAIALQRKLAFAYLNRGLAYQRRGELDRALADLDRAVRLAPNAARGYYNRSLVLRQRGNARRAEADQNRAVEMDPGYAAVVK